MLSATELNYVQHLERGYCINHPDVVIKTKTQVVDRAVKQLLEALQSNGFELDGDILKRGNGWLKFDAGAWQYSNDAGDTWAEIGGGSDALSGIFLTEHQEDGKHANIITIAGEDAEHPIYLRNHIIAGQQYLEFSDDLIGWHLIPFLTDGKLPDTIMPATVPLLTDGKLSPTVLPSTPGATGSTKPKILLEYVNASTIRLIPGIITSVDGQEIEIQNSMDIDFTNNLAYGVTKNPNTKYRVVLGYNTANTLEAVLVTTEDGVASEHSSPSLLSHPALLPGCVRTNANNNIIRFIMSPNMYLYIVRVAGTIYDETQVFGETLGASVWSPTAVSCLGFVPAETKIVLLSAINPNLPYATDFVKWRPAGDPVIDNALYVSGQRHFPNIPMNFGNLHGSQMYVSVVILGFDVM